MSNYGSIIRDILDNESNGARSLGLLSETKTVKGSLSSRDKDFNDFYRFSLRSSSNASITLSKLQRNVDLRLLDGTGKLIATSQNSDRRAELISRELGAGTYFVQVRWGRGGSRGRAGNPGGDRARYALTLSPTLSIGSNSSGGSVGQPTLINPNDGGNDIPSAVNGGDLTNARLYRTTIGGSDTADYYRFNLTRTSVFEARVQNVKEGNVQLELIYDSNGNGQVDMGEQLGNGELIKTPLGAGSYLLGILPSTVTNDRAISYDLQVGAVAVTDLNPANDPGDLPATAHNLGSLNGAINLKQFIGTTDSKDVYRFRLDQVSGLGISFSGAPADTQLRLVYDGNGNGLIDSDDPLVWDLEGSNAKSTQVKTLSAGSYLVQIAQKLPQSNFLYNLDLFSTPVSGLNPINDPGSGLGTAHDIGRLTASSQGRPRSEVNLRQVLGSGDSADVYRFELADQVNTFKATLNASSLSDDVTMALVYDRDGDNFMDLGDQEGDRVIAGDFIGGTFLSPGEQDKASIEKTLGQGTYFLVVTQKETIENTVYDLNVMAQGLTGTYAAPDPVQSGAQPPIGPYLSQATQLRIDGTTYSQFVGSTDAKDVYQFTVDGTAPRNLIIKLAGLSETVEVRFARDRNGNGRIDFAVDSEEKVLPAFDLNGNEELDLDEGEVFQPSKGNVFGAPPDVIYSPLPPYHDETAFFNLPIDNGWVTSVPTDIYARLNPGTYYIEIERAGFSAELGDDRVRTGFSNSPYTLTLLPA